eukprot:6789822-Alexandrium_andersonii.AAC.1
MSASLVGSEMCIRDSFSYAARRPRRKTAERRRGGGGERVDTRNEKKTPCLLYTSDAADDM